MIEKLKPKAREAGLWNLFLPSSADGHTNTSGDYGIGLSNQDTRRWPRSWAACPGQRGLQLLGAGHRQHGNDHPLRQRRPQEAVAEPLLEGKIRSAFAMTEPAVASSDATNIEARIERQGDEYLINGRKWWTSGAGDPRCKIYIFMGKTDPSAPARAAVDGAGAGRDAGRQGAAPAERIRLRRRAARPHGSAVRERARAGLEHPARRRPRLRDRAGPPRPRPHPPLHAPDRPGRAFARADVQARHQARGLPPPARRAGRDARAHRRRHAA